MLITFTGRKSGKMFTTPVRYIEIGRTIRCFTSKESQWWRNIRGGADVVLRIRGKDFQYNAVAIDNNTEEVKKCLASYLEMYPQDAAYHHIKMNKDKTLVAEDLERASYNAIVVEANPSDDNA
jgi:deazaflavin-dependent oxidoreductase (nitroreductase family)